MSTNKIHKTK